jgi:type IV secretory pathway VirJ component
VTRAGALVAALLVAGTAHAPRDRLEVDRFAPAALERGSDHPARVVVFFLCGDSGWNWGVVDRARVLGEQDALVLGVDVAHYLRQVGASRGDCAAFAVDVEQLSQKVQKKLGRPRDSPPVRVGSSSGATPAYATLVQASPNTFRGALSLGCPELALAKPACRGRGLESRRRADGNGYELLQNWQPELQDAFVRVADSALVGGRRPAAGAATPVADLPLVEVPAAEPAGDLLAVVISGDGGWASLDREVAGVLAARGVPVVGLDSLQYFWTRRTPDEAGAALERLLDHYLAAWRKRSVILIGYSRGANVLPFMASRLPTRLRRSVVLIALLGPGRTAELEFHVADWVVDRDRPGAQPLLPEVAKLRGTKLLCVYGAEEEASLCPTLPEGTAVLDRRPGAHHFGGDYAALAEKILAEARP